MSTNETSWAMVKKLACLEINEPAQDKQFAAEVANIMDFVTPLCHVNTTDVKPLFHPYQLQPHLRKDEVSEENQSQQLGEIAPLFANHFYLVPKVLD